MRNQGYTNNLLVSCEDLTKSKNRECPQLTFRDTLLHHSSPLPSTQSSSFAIPIYFFSGPPTAANSVSHK